MEAYGNDEDEFIQQTDAPKRERMGTMVSSGSGSGALVTNTSPIQTDDAGERKLG